jgi:hypothetical protein
MQKISKNLNFVLISAILSAAIFTWISPKVLGLLFTPPVSFGTNCEPAASWSMNKLIWTQVIGLILGSLGAAFFLATRKGKPELPEKTPINTPSLS